MNSFLRMVKRKLLLIISVIMILLLSTYILKTWKSIIWKDPFAEINENQEVDTKDQGLELQYHGYTGAPMSIGLALFKDLLILNKEIGKEGIKDQGKPNKTEFSQKLKIEYDEIVGLIHNVTGNKSNMNTPMSKSKAQEYVNQNNTNLIAFDKNISVTGSNPNVETPWHNSIALSRRTKNCKTYFESFPSIVSLNSVLKEEERKLIKEPFSLAFSHMLHKDVSIFEIFLALYFRPNNFHCVHVDYKAPDNVRKNVEDLVTCYKTKINQGEIFVIPKNQSISVNWGEMSVLDADMRCHSELLSFNKIKDNEFQWKYVASLAGSELPIVPYSRFHNKISTHLKNNLSSVESFNIPELNQWRFDNKDKDEISHNINGIEDISYKVAFVISNPGEKNFSRTLNFKIYKGLKNVILSYRDTEYLINHPFSRQLYDWFKETDFPEEHFFPTFIRTSVDPDTLMIHQNQSAEFLYQDSGGLTYTTGDTLHGLCPRYTQWMERYDCINNIGCFGECLNAICNLHTLDLGKISDQVTDCLIANKFNLDVDPMAVTFQFFNIMRETMNELNNFKDWLDLFQKIANMKFMQL